MRLIFLTVLLLVFIGGAGESYAASTHDTVLQVAQSWMKLIARRTG